MNYQAPNDALDVLQHIEHEQALEPGDPRYVDTQEARGSQKTLNRLARKFGLDLISRRFSPATKRHVLFFGHIGSGKTTELRRYAKELSASGKFFVVEVDVAQELDIRNLQYVDVFMTMAKTLMHQLNLAQITLTSNALAPLEEWFSKRVSTNAKFSEYAAEIKTGVEGRLSLPFLANMFALVTTAFKTNATYKDEMRREIRNTFAEFASAFNALLREAELALAREQKAERVLFVVDGTDKLRAQDQKSFFVHDGEQLLAIDAHVIYTAPLNLKYEGNLVGKLDDLVLPMIKLHERDGSRCEAGWQALTSILLKRAQRSLFASDAEIARIVAHSGGHPRELLRLLKLCCEFQETGTIDADIVESAIKQLASEYRRFLEPDDYVALVKIDRDAMHGGNDERTRKLLYNLALLEYNDGGWQRSHPVVKLLEGYRRAAAPVPLIPESPLPET